MVSKDFLDAQMSKVNVRISIRDLDGVPKDHHQVCDCNYTWDGKSTHCSGKREPNRRLRMTWRTQKEHHFLKPLFEPFCY